MVFIIIYTLQQYLVDNTNQSIFEKTNKIDETTKNNYSTLEDPTLENSNIIGTKSIAIEHPKSSLKLSKYLTSLYIVTQPNVKKL